MPELPEVEAIAQTLRPLIVGQKIRGCRIIHGVAVGSNAGRDTDGRRALLRSKGCRVRAVERKGKYLLARLDRGWLVFHFRLDGQVVWYSPRRPPRHIDVAFDFRKGTLGFVDRRHLGRVTWVDILERQPGIAALGVDPLSKDFSDAVLAELFRGAARAVKPALMDQRKIAGLGNIWSCESLWQARIDPRRRAGRLRGDETGRLGKAIVGVLRCALESCLDPPPDLRDPEWWFERADAKIRVYGREGRPCPRCRHRIRRVRQGGRSTFYCPGCQG